MVSPFFDKLFFVYFSTFSSHQYFLNAISTTNYIIFVSNVNLLPFLDIVDWRKAGIVSAVKDQGHCGSCWAFASTAVIESAVAKASGMLFDLSVQQMAMCAPNPDKCGGTGNCAGSTAELAFDYVAKSTGMVEEFMYGYGAYYGNVTSCEVPEGPPKASIGGYEQLPTNELKPFMNALYTEGPISISVDASTWHAYHSGIYDGCDASKPDIDHAVVAGKSKSKIEVSISLYTVGILCDITSLAYNHCTDKYPL